MTAKQVLPCRKLTTFDSIVRPEDLLEIFLAKDFILGKAKLRMRSSSGYNKSMKIVVIRSRTRILNPTFVLNHFAQIILSYTTRVVQRCTLAVASVSGTFVSLGDSSANHQVSSHTWDGASDTPLQELGTLLNLYLACPLLVQGACIQWNCEKQVAE